MSRSEPERERSNAHRPSIGQASRSQESERMSGMSGMLRIPLRSAEAPPHATSRMKGTAAQDALPVPKKGDAPFIRRMREDLQRPDGARSRSMLAPCPAHASTPRFWIYTRSLNAFCPRSAGIQTGRVKRMSGMSKSKRIPALARLESKTPRRSPAPKVPRGLALARSRYAARAAPCTGRHHRRRALGRPWYRCCRRRLQLDGRCRPPPVPCRG